MKRIKKFYPDYLAEVVVTILICIEVLIVIALLYPPAIGRQIDLARQFLPRPEWYFLWLFELVGYFPGETEFVGTVITPLLYVLLFISIPFIDRGQRGRLWATLAVSVLFLSFIALTLISVLK
jgi:quinol-cytochrome oxidoreductase complex cytochrome b subunit